MSGPVFVTGHRGLLGQALLRALSGREILTATRSNLDLTNSEAVHRFLAEHRPGAVIHAAARNGGLRLHESGPSAMLADNLAMAVNVIRGAHDAGIGTLINVSSACVYTAATAAPAGEASAGINMPEGLTANYALAKIAGMRLCDAYNDEDRPCFCSIIPCNLYGPGDNYHRDDATVVPSMMRRMHEATRAHLSTFNVWGSGRQTREFLHVDDLAAACVLLLDAEELPPRVNCGPGLSTTMLELAAALKNVIGFLGEIEPDPSKPEGAPRPGLDISLLRSLGWQPRIPLADGLRSTYAAFLEATAAGTLRA